MNEHDWLSCTDPRILIAEAWERRRSPRWVFLFSAACCRRIWPLLFDERDREAVEILERYADGRATPVDLYQAWIMASGADDGAHVMPQDLAEVTDAVRAAVDCQPPYEPEDPTKTGVFKKVIPQAEHCASCCARAVSYGRHSATMDDAYAYVDSTVAPDFDLEQRERAAQCGVLRDIFGNPFRRISLNKQLITTRVLTLARHIYDSRDFTEMPSLADAMQLDGCEDFEILNHLRQQEGHVRGCWAVDMILQA